jgi:hypothetical protein
MRSVPWEKVFCRELKLAMIDLGADDLVEAPPGVGYGAY